MTIGVAEETTPGERRVALVPETVGRLVDQDYEVLIERGAGASAYYADEAYEEKGARLVGREAAFGADIVVRVQPPSEEEISLLKEGSLYIGFLQPLDEPAFSQKLAEQGVTALSMELVPRISRAQKMDALSAMSSIGGYKAVLKAANTLPKFFPLLSTAAGTIRPATALILGAGVAGLQAIATARRLGAKAFAYDIREAVREEVQSLGAKFVELQLETENAQDEAGYAKELQEKKQEQQTELLVPHIGRADVVITTALIPGRPAPTLITEEAVQAMDAGSVIVDMAAQNGGNCVLTEPGETITRHDVHIIGALNLPAEVPVHASQMYANTLRAMVTEFSDADGVHLDFDDDIFKGACVTHQGEVVHERVKSILSTNV